METINNKTYDEERALYGLHDAKIENCKFAGKADGESALKETRNIAVNQCDFKLRYPLWHTENFTLCNSEMFDTCRAALWYAKCGKVSNCKLFGVKALRECHGIDFESCDIESTEFGWKCEELNFSHCNAVSEYIFLMSKNMKIRDFSLSGKYSFQYTENTVIENSVLNTKDAFWHSENVTVKNSVINGEYLGWYSKNLTLINCKIKGTQPLCYCENLKLVNCETEDCDLAFEYSAVEADIKGHIDSVKNPKSGYIRANSYGEIIKESALYPCDCEIIQVNK